MIKTALNTPCYIVLEDEFNSNIKLFRGALNKYFGQNAIIGYSFKTNSLPYLVNCAKKLGCYAETVSDTEYELALKLGYKENKIIYNGPIKSKALFKRALASGSIINLDSERELAWLEECDEYSNEKEIGVRVNFDVESILPGQTSMGEKGGRFGFCDDNGDLTRAIQRIKKLKNIKLCGLHMHVSSKSKSTDIYEILTKRACEIAKREDLELKYLDIGGGFFGGGDGGKAYDNYIHKIYDVLSEYNMQRLTLIVEPGASVVATAFDYVVSVIDVKQTTMNKFVVTDGSRIHVDPFMRKSNYALSLPINDNKTADVQTLCGYTCMENDRFTELANKQELSVGDVIRFHVVGSYTMCFTPLFIQYLPRVYAASGDKYKLVRELWGADEYLQKNIID